MHHQARRLTRPGALALLCLAASVLLVSLGHAQVAVAQAPAGATGTAPSSAAAVPERRGTELGYAVFQQHCVSCHGNPAYARAPSPAALRSMTPERIYTALTSGLMKSVGDTLSDQDRRRVAESLSGQLLGAGPLGDARKMPNRCARNPPLRPAGPSWNGWGNGPANNRFQTAAAAGLSAAQVPGLTLRWAFGFPGGTSAHAQPAVFAGRVFVGSDTGYVYSLDSASGCVYWSYRTQAGVRNAMTLGRITAQGRSRYAVFFGDLKANAYAIDAHSGRQIWRRHVDDNYTTRITAAPAFYRGTLYVPVSAWEGFQARVLDYPCCTAVGSVSALDASSGKLLWKTYSIAQRPHPTHKNSHGVELWAPAGAPIWNTPTIDPQRDALYVGTGDATTYPAPATSDAILALDLKTGRRLWSRQIYANDSFIIGCSGRGVTDNCPRVVGVDWDIPMSPILTRLTDGRAAVVFGTKPGDILALDPDRQGAVIWRTNVIGPGAVAAARQPGGRIRGPLWGGAVDDGYVYFGLNAGGVAAVRLADGQRTWYNPLNSTPQQRVTHSAAATAIPGVVFVGGSDGRLWALASSDGHPLWSFETAHPFNTVNRVPAHGGSIMAPGPVVAGGMLFVGSGYGVVSNMPGNVLLAFGLE